MYVHCCKVHPPVDLLAPLAAASRDTNASHGRTLCHMSHVTEKAKLAPQKAEEGEFTDLEGLDLTSKLDLLRKNEQWKCQVKKEALEVCTVYGLPGSHVLDREN